MTTFLRGISPGSNERTINLGPVKSCPICGSPTVIKKTVNRMVKTVSGIVVVGEHISSCPIQRKNLRPKRMMS